MDHFNYQQNQLHAENVAVADIIKQHGTPCYIYSRATLERHWRVFDETLSPHPHQIYYAVKANSNIAILNLFARLGSGFDIVSVGELERVLAAGGKAKQVIFSGVGKQAHEIERGLETGIHCFNVESMSELELIQKIAKAHGSKAPISFRINPNVDPGTHPYISTGLKENKFGIENEKVFDAYLRAQHHSHCHVIGIACHIGSQLTQLQPFVDALDCVLEWVDELYQHGIQLQHLDLGGGLGVRYHDETPPTPTEYAQALFSRLRSRQLTLGIEPGRAIAANAGILVTKVQYLKETREKNFAILDAAMNDLLRPALYQAYHDIIRVHSESNSTPKRYDLVGPVCETGDFLAKQRRIALMENDLLAIRGAGAYGFTMSSNYNTRPRAAEILVDGDQCYCIREREPLASLFEFEHLLPD